jgi:hypothetical protein
VHLIVEHVCNAVHHGIYMVPCLASALSLTSALGVASGLGLASGVGLGIMYSLGKAFRVKGSGLNKLSFYFA